MVVDFDGANVESLLKKFEISGLDNVYELGCSATPQNVHSQQQRAFNLVWALDKADKIQATTRVAVVGAGIAGLSVTAGLLALGCKVHLYESMRDVMHLQQGNLTRFLHPNISLWPDDGYGYPLTHLPFMNWRSGSAGDVEAQLRRQWERMREYGNLSGVLKIKLNRNVKRIKRTGNQAAVIYEKSKVEKRKLFDLAVIACGYGMETPSLSNTPSYWRNDDFAQRVVGVKNKIRYLVSGTGDGGLIDVLRLAMSEFQHQKFFQDFMYLEPFQRLGRQLKQRLLNESAEAVWTDFLNGTEVLDPDIEETLDLIFSDVSIRPDTDIVLNSTRECPFKTESQLFHRLLVGVLLRRKKIRHIPGELKEVFLNKVTGEIIASIANPHGESVHALTDFLIQRHNAIPVLAKLLGRKGRHRQNKLRKKWRNDTSYQPQHRPWFLADAFMESHYELKYEVGIVVEQSLMSEVAQRLLLRVGRDKDAQDCIGPDWMPPRTYNWGDGRWLSISWNPHTFLGYPSAPLQRNCLVLETNSRELLERCLYPDEKYQYYRIFPTRTDFATDPAPVDMHTGAWILTLSNDGSKFFEVQFWDHGDHTHGMYEAHRLLRLPTLLEIVFNRWPTTRVHGVGWALWVLRGADLRIDKRGNTLLQWENQIAWWQPNKPDEKLSV